MPIMTVHEIERFLAAEFPQGFNPQSGLTIEGVWQHGCRVRQTYRSSSLRPGGTISGPTMMALADFAMYVALRTNSLIGEKTASKDSTGIK